MEGSGTPLDQRGQFRVRPLLAVHAQRHLVTVAGHGEVEQVANGPSVGGANRVHVIADDNLPSQGVVVHYHRTRVKFSRLVGQSGASTPAALPSRRATTSSAVMAWRQNSHTSSAVIGCEGPPGDDVARRAGIVAACIRIVVSRLGRPGRSKPAAAASSTIDAT